MNDSSAFHADTPSASTASATPSRLTMDRATRVMHWLMAVCFAGAYLTAESEYWRFVHTTLGYTALGLVLTRLAWGMTGPRHARLAAWVQRIRGTLTQPGRPLTTQTLLHAVTVLALLAGVVLTTATGVVNDQSWAGDWAEEVHETLGNLLLLLVVAHVGLLLLGSWLRKRNLFMPMISGRTPGAGPDLVKHPHSLLAAALLAMALAFWGWRYTQAPPPEAGDEAFAEQGESASKSGQHNNANEEDEDKEDDDD